MVYNIWNDPETDIIEAAINRFVNSIDDEDIELTLKVLKEPYPRDIDGYESIRTKFLLEMRDTYFIDIDDVNNLDYFNRKLKERLRKHGFDLEKDLWERK